MFDIKEFNISEANEYRYTLIDKTICFDFIIRDNDVHFLSSAGKYKVIDPNIDDSELMRLKCNFGDNTFTHFIMRSNPYFDRLQTTKHMEHKLIIIQDFRKKLNLVTKFKPLPLFNDVLNLYLPNNEILIKYNKFKNGSIRNKRIG